MKTNLYATIGAGKENLVRLLQDLVRIPTVNPPGDQYPAITDYLAARLRALGFATRIHRVPLADLRRVHPELAAWPRANVLARWPVGAKKTLHFNAHTDVVPVSGKWKYGPFTPTVRGGWLYGRGAADMKGSIASLLHALAIVRRLGLKPKTNIEVSLTADEETDSAFGAEWIIRRRLVRGDYVVVCEGGSGNRIGCGHNGTVWLEVEIVGRATHGSTPHFGINAVESMSALIGELGRYRDSLAKKTFAAPDRNRRHATLNIGGETTTGPGGKINIVPGSVVFTLDRRVLPNERLNEAEAELKRAVRAAAGVIPRAKVRIRRINCHASSFIDPAHPFPCAVAAAVKRVRGAAPRFTVSSGFNDAHFFAAAGGLPTIGYGPEGENEHGIDERVSIQDLIRTACVYADLMLSFAG